MLNYFQKLKAFKPRAREMFQLPIVHFPYCGIHNFLTKITAALQD